MNKLSFLAIGSMALTLFLSAPVHAQYSIPSGYPTPPAGFDSTMEIPDIPDIPEGYGPPAGLQEKMNQGLSRLKKGAQSMQKAVDQMNKAIQGATTAGYPPAQTLLDETQKGQDAVNIIKNATSLDESVENAIDQFNAFIDILDVNIGPLNMLKNFTRITKQADREIPKLSTAFDKAKKNLAKSDFDMTEQFAEIEQRIQAVKTVYESSKTAAKNGDAEQAFSLLENDFFPELGDIHQSIGMLQAVKNLSRASTQINRGIQTAEKIVKKLKSAGQDVAELQTIIKASKAKLEEFKAVLKTKNFEPETAVDILDELDGLRADFETKLEFLYDESENDDLGTRPAPVNFFQAPATTIPKEFKAAQVPQTQFEKIDF